MPTSRKARQAIIKHLPSSVNTIYELGSGWGGLAYALAKARPGATIHAYEISTVPWLVSLLFFKMSRVKNIRLYRKNFYNISLREADLIVCYLFPGAMQRLSGAAFKEKTIVISNSFSLPRWKAEKRVFVDDLWRSEIFFYQR